MHAQQLPSPATHTFALPSHITNVTTSGPSLVDMLSPKVACVQLNQPL